MIGVVIFEIEKKCYDKECVEKHVLLTEDGDYDIICKCVGSRIVSSIFFPTKIIDVKLILKKDKFLLIRKMRELGYIKFSNNEWFKPKFLGGVDNEKK